MEVIIYSTPTCKYCDLAKEYLAGKGISYAEYNVKDDAEKKAEMIALTGQLRVPVIVINGKAVIGFDNLKNII